MSHHTLTFDCRVSPFGDRAVTRSYTASADDLLAFLTPYIAGLLKADMIRAIRLWEYADDNRPSTPTRLAEFAEDMVSLRERLRQLSIADRLTSIT
jgi:hypothetical protein